MRDLVGSLRCRLGKRLSRLASPAYDAVEVYLSAHLLRAASADFYFPNAALVSIELPSGVRSGNPFATDIPIAPTSIHDALSEFALCLNVSGDLFVPLGRPSKGGKNYRATKAPPVPAIESPLDTARQKGDRVDGFRRSFKRTQHDRNHASIEAASIWDIIFPLLQPPISGAFSDVLDLPPQCEPYGYQWAGIKFLVDHDGALLGDDMGTGKTVQSILAMRLLFQRGQIKSALIVCPLSVLRNWDREAEKWARDLLLTVVRGAKEVRTTCWRTPTHIWLTTYDTLRQDIETLQQIDRGRFDLVILDEAQRIKNPGTGITQAVRSIRGGIRWGLTGTPIENKLDELVSIFRYLKPEIVKREWETPAEAKAAIKDHFLRRRKADVLKDLPQKHEMPVYLRMSEAQMQSYGRMESERVLQLHRQGTAITAGNILTLITELKKICNRDPATGESVKLEWLKESLEDISAGGDKVLVFTQYREARFGGSDWLTDELADYGTINYSSASTDRQRDAVLTSFRTDPTKVVFVGNPRTAGVGVNELVVANYVVHFDHWWNPAIANQATDRAHRPKQTKTVFVYHLWVEDTIEEMIQKKLEEKQLLYDVVIDSLSTEATEGLLFDLYDDLLVKHGFQRMNLSKPTIVDADSSTRSPVNRQLEPIEFEKITANLFNALGYNTRHMGGTRDRGIDVVAVKSMGISTEKIGIQCKLVSSPVGRPVLDQLLGVISSDPSYTRGVLVTNNRLSSEARAFLQANGRLSALEGEDIKKLLAQQNMHQVLARL